MAGKENGAPQRTQEKREQTDAEIKSAIEFNKGWSHRIAVFITDVFGSMVFLFVMLLLFTVWVTWNLRLLPGLKPFDPFPFPMLTMIVSLFAIVLSIAVLMSQNRQGRIEKVRQQVEFEVNVRAEIEITKMLEMLHQIQKKLGIAENIDPELEEMKEKTDIQQLHQKLDDMD